MDNINIPMSRTTVISEKNINQEDNQINRNNRENTNINNNQSSNNEEVSSSLISIIFFVLITTIFTVIVYINIPNNIPDTNLNTNSMYFMIYILILVIGNYFINLNITKSVCGGQPQWATTMMNTIIPWILIFGIMNIVLIIFPGWITPFANTFGYGAMNLLGLKDLLNVILNINKSNPDNTLTSSQKLVARGIEEIYGNSSLFINQVPTEPDKFKDFVKTLISTGYFRKGLNINSNEIISLYKLIQLKELVGKYIWNLLTGILVTTVSYNYIINSGCNNSIKQMQTKRNNFLISERERQESRSNNRLYYPFVIGENNSDIDVKSSSFSRTNS